MIPPRDQWAIQIDVTSRCGRACSNCTRFTGHGPIWDMGMNDFERACEVAAEFVEQKKPEAGPNRRKRVVGLIGGEPRLHWNFGALCGLLAAYVSKDRRGLWTGKPIKWASDERLITETFGYVNLNVHGEHHPSYHQPALVAVKDVITDREQMWRVIDACPLQRDWACSINPHGFWFCEVAGAFDMLDRSGTGMTVESGCWSHDLDAYQAQIERWCPNCGICLPLETRLDRMEVDDVSPSNLAWLKQIGSPRVVSGQYCLYDVKRYRPPENWAPLQYSPLADAEKRDDENFPKGRWV